MPTADAVEARKTQVLADLITREVSSPRRILVVGCGTGAEAGALARILSAETTGIDIDDAGFDPARAAPARLIEMDAETLQFDDAAFDLVYAFHSLEHMSDPRKALAEMRRVLIPGGCYLVGTPNKRRLVGYVGSPVPVREKVAWNIDDLKARLRGQWSNEAGAHAGFSRAELHALCSDAFGVARDITDDYYAALYPSHQRGLGLAQATRIAGRIYPSVYIAGRVE